MDDTSTVDDVYATHNGLLVPGGSMVDITESKDGGVLKELLKAGVAEEFPFPGDRVTVKYDALFADGKRFDSSQFRSDSKYEFVLGKGEVICHVTML